MTRLYPLNLFLKVLLLLLADLLNLAKLLLHFDLCQLLITRALGVSGLSHAVPVCQLRHHTVHLLLLHYLKICLYLCLRVSV